MAVFHIILWDNPLVLHPLFIEKVNSIGLLQKGVSDVLFILQDLLQCFWTPLRFPGPGKNPVCFQATPDLEQACPFQVLPVNPLYHFRLCRLYDQISFLILCVTQKTAVIDPDLPVLETVLQSKFDVLAQRLAFLLCQARHNGKQHLTLGIRGVDVLFFKENRDVLLLQFSDILQTIQGVSGKTADGLGNDHINVSVHAVLDHAVKFLPLFRICSSDPVISINPGQFPFRILLDKLRIMRHLHLIA